MLSLFRHRFERRVPPSLRPYSLRVNVGRGYLAAAVVFFVFYACLAYSYNVYLYPLYSYMGARELEIGMANIVLWAVFAFAAPFFCGMRLQRPGDFLLAILYVAVVPSAIVLNGANRYAADSLPLGFMGGVDTGVGLGILIVSLANLVVIRRPEDLHKSGAGRLPGWLLGANLLAVALILVKTWSYFSFDFGGQYTRRSLARDVFASGSFLAYYCSIFTQGLFPVFLGYGIYLRKHAYTLAGLLSVLVLWGGTGQKYPFFVLVLVVGLMLWYRGLGYVHILLLPLAGIFVIFAGIVEDQLFDYSYINDYLLRRIYAVASTLLGAAQLYVSDHGMGYYKDTLLGALVMGKRSESLTFSVGATIFRRPDINANVDFLALAWMQGGLAAAAAEALAVSVIVIILNRIYQQYRDVMAVCIAVLLASKIVEQSLLTALVSSGTFLMIVALHLMTRQRSGPRSHG